MLDATPLLPICPTCSGEFAPNRKDQRFCGRECQKNAARGPRTVDASATERLRQVQRNGRLRSLSDHFHRTPPAYRAEFLAKLIVEARRLKELRGLVTQRPLLCNWSREEGTGRLSMVHVLDHFCKEVYGLRSFVVLDPKTKLPDAGALAFPAAYFGPDAPPVYEDGGLKVRPCPWATGKKVKPGRQSASTAIKGEPSGAAYDWRKIARAMRDPGWQNYFTKDELDEVPAYDCLPQQR